MPFQSLLPESWTLVSGLAALTDRLLSCGSRRYLGALRVILLRRVNFPSLFIVKTYFLSCYISSNVLIDVFHEFLDELDRLTMYISDKYIICGDFNLKSTLWGCPLSDRRGNKLSNWAASRDLRLINSGEVPTFMGARGSSIIDLTWASSSLVNSVQNWSVLQEVEPLGPCIHFYARRRLIFI